MARILVAIDEDNVYRRVLDTVQKTFEAHQHVNITVVHFRFEEGEGNGLKQAVDNWTADTGLSADFEFVDLDELESSRIANEVALRLAKKSVDYDYIVIGTRQERGLFRLLKGQTASSLIERAACPVLVVPTPKEVVDTEE